MKVLIFQARAHQITFCSIHPLLGLFHRLQYYGGGWGVIGDVRTVHIVEKLEEEGNLYI